jgi:hypothetical protein
VFIDRERGETVLADQTGGVKFEYEGISRYRFAILFRTDLGTQLLPQLLEQYSSGIFLFNDCSSLLDSPLTFQSCKFILITLNSSCPASQKTRFLFQHKVSPVSVV